MKRKIVQILCNNNYWYALCDDGTVWGEDKGEWREMVYFRDIPQPEAQKGSYSWIHCGDDTCEHGMELFISPIPEASGYICEKCGLYKKAVDTLFKECHTLQSGPGDSIDKTETPKVSGEAL